MNEQVKVVALDLDGTLLNSNNEISDFNKDILWRLKERGVHIILCTGRPYNAMKKFRDELSLDDHVICFNGANIVDKDEKLVLDTSLDTETSLELVKVGRVRNTYFHGFMEDKWLVPYTNEISEKYKARTGLTETVGALEEVEGLRFTKMMYIGENALLREIYEELDEKLGERVYKAFSNPNFLEVLSGSSSKAKALDFFLKEKGLTPENLLVMGDSYNDLEMLKFAKYGVVMENTPEELKEQFDLIAPGNDEDGVGRYLRDFFEL
jgi:Cof subfamily protein (haloacid dehalogenase superfamily)